MKKIIRKISKWQNHKIFDRKEKSEKLNEKIIRKTSKWQNHKIFDRKEKSEKTS